MSSKDAIRAWLTIGTAQAIVAQWLDGEIRSTEAKILLVRALRMTEIPQ